MNEVETTPMAQPPLIHLENVRRVFRKGDYEVAALDGINLTIQPGEFVSIIGASGSGKSTLLHVLGCLDRPTHGSYALHGVQVQDFTDVELSAVRNRFFGFVFQDAHLLAEANVVENTALPLVYSGVPRRDRLAAGRAVAEAVGLGDRATHRPAELSGGQVQRVAIARALVSHPDVVLADEPTGNLDSDNTRTVLSAFDEFTDRGGAVLLVTHDDAVAQQARLTVRLIDGALVSSTGD